MNDIDLHELVGELIQELCFDNETFPIIVEGKNDEAALRQLGLKGVIVRLNIGLSIINFCEEIARKYDEVILLPDWDQKGKQLFKKLKLNFQNVGVKTNKKYWRDFKRFCSKEVQQVEHFDRFAFDFAG